jgi:hypothetical protein
VICQHFLFYGINARLQIRPDFAPDNQAFFKIIFRLIRISLLQPRGTTLKVGQGIPRIRQDRGIEVSGRSFQILYFKSNAAALQVGNAQI